MIHEDNLFSTPPFSLCRIQKNDILIKKLNQLLKHHTLKCDIYARILKAYEINQTYFEQLEDFPFLSVRLFKHHEIKSIDNSSVIKVLTSSGTTGQKTANIYIDKITSIYQTKALVLIMQEFLGKQRLPMLIFDNKEILTTKQKLSARGAGVFGFSNFGRDHTYALNTDMTINFSAIEQFIKNHRNKKVLLFGFTFIIWKHIIMMLQQSDCNLDFSNAILIHGGGWKKLLSESVDNQTFRRVIKERLGISSIHNYYGMVEQVGSIFMECEMGYLHCPFYSNVIIRDIYDWKVKPNKEPGIIQSVSILPVSYPGHSLLTEDIGVILGEDDCKCGKKGKYFQVLGRMPRAEARGCSDTYETQ